jgi:hypothetical protein
MPIKWSAVKVSEAMDEIELQLVASQPFIDTALTKAREARNISNLPLYIDERIGRLIYDIEEKFGHLKTTITSVRKAIPDGAIEAEHESTKHGTTQSLI